MGATKLEQIKSKLIEKSFKLYSLTPEEAALYLRYRLDQLINTKYIITRRELIYLLCETGIGSLRFDPELIYPLLKPEYYEKFSIEDKRMEKLSITESVLQDIASKALKDNYYKKLSPFLQELNIISYNPFIMDGSFQACPIRMLIKNGDWIMPNIDLFTFLNQTYKDKRLPILIAKKIHGILFPFFKSKGIFGINEYRVLVSTSTFAKYLDCNNLIPNEEVLLPIKYNEQLTDYLYEEPYNNFFTSLLPTHYDKYYKSFLKHFSPVASNFEEHIITLKNPLRRNLEIWHTWQKTVIKNLN